MLEELTRLSHKFLEMKNSSYRRYFIRTTPFSSRLSILIGSRGVGKTTTIIQTLLDFTGGDLFSPKILYVQADHFALGALSLYEIAEHFQMLGGEWIVLDEIHKYPNWSQELKSIYDTFPKLKVLASGSSALQITKGSHDLSRRALVFRMQGMSFREYLELAHHVELPAYSLNELCRHHINIAHEIIQKFGKKIIPEFHRYLQIGYYPYFYEMENDSFYKMTLEQNVHTTIESDLASVYPQLTGVSMRKIKELLVFIAHAVPFTPNWSSLKSMIEVGDLRTLKTYFSHLEDAELIQSLSKSTQKIRRLESPSKIYLNNPNQLYAIASQVPDKGTVRETFFLNMTLQNHEVTLPGNGDFLINQEWLFEVGGKNKGFEQICLEKNGYLACDDLEQGAGNKIPLWLFGFLY
ncbi:MAG: AAA family ATPase [Chlamydiales bacterium]|nr:AAA family ATPase [Chlamydiales bacterium]